MNLTQFIRAKINPILPLAALVVICGCQKQEQTPPATAAPPGIVSAEKTSFDEVTSKLDKGGNFYLYLSTEQTLAGLSEKLSAFSNFLGNLPGTMDKQQLGRFYSAAQNWLTDSGIEQISGVGMSSIAREPGFYYSKLIVHHYKGETPGVIWSLLGKSPHPLDELDLLPETTVLAMFSDFDAPLLWADIQKHVKELGLAPADAALAQFPEQFQKGTGLDLDSVLSSLGGNYGILMTLDPDKKISIPIPNASLEVPSPGLAIVAKVKSDVIFNRVDALATNNPLVVRVDTPDLKMRTMTVPLPLPIELRPSIARSGDYLLLASSDTLVHDILDVKAGKKKGFKSTPEFAHLSQGIPTEGNNFTLIAEQFTKSLLAIQQQTLTNKGAMTSEQVEAFQKAFHTGTNFGNFTVGANGAEGWEGVGNGAQSMQSMLLPAIAVVGVGAAIAIPNFIKARQAAQKGTTYQPAPDHGPAGPNPAAEKPKSTPAIAARTD